MSGKYYPDEVVRQKVNTGIWAHPWRGSVSAMLLQEEAELLNSVIESLYGRDDVSEELGDELEKLQEEISAILKNGQSRMDQLHSVLGGYDLSESGAISKPDSERTRWPKGAFAINPELRLVKNDEEDKGES